MKSKMIGVFAVLMIALMAVGFTYASWSPTLQINGNVATGNVDAAFSVTGLYEGTGDNEILPLDVGKCIAQLDDSKTMTVTINNAYPGYECWVWFTILDLGTVPGKIESVDLTVDSELEVKVGSVAPATEVTMNVLSWVTIHVLPGAAELATYTFTITFTVVADV